MWSFIQQLLLHGCFLVVLYTVSYANRNPYSYPQIDHLRNFFFDSNNPTQNYLQVFLLLSFINLYMVDMNRYQQLMTIGHG